MTKNKTIKKAERESLNIKDKLLEALKASAPEVFGEGKVNWDKVRLALGEHLDASSEKFNFTWAGKAGAVTNVLIPSKATLRPDKKESVKFDTSENLFIEGDNLEVLKLLQKSYFEQVKMIYIDPPYNTGNDFVYKDDFRQPLKNYLEQSGQVDSDGNRLSTNTQASGRFHSDWLTMMYPRLKLAWNLLRHDGVIFVSIDDNEVHHLRMMMDEIFGEENFVDTICWKKKYGGGAKEKYLVSVHEYILMYAKSKIDLSEIMVEFDEEKARRFYKYKDEKFETLGYYRTHPLEAVKSFDIRQNLRFPVIAPDGKEVWPKRQWRWSKERFAEAIKKNDVIFSKNKDKEWVLYSKQYLNEENGEQRKTKAQSVIDDIFTQEGTREIVDIFGDAKIFPFPKPVKLLQKLIEIGGLSENEIVIDFFAGSATTAHAVLAQNQEDGGKRKFIMVQMPEPTDLKSEAYKAGYKTITDIAKERIRRVLKGYGDHKPIDDGFKVFKLGRSNYYDNLFEYDPDKSAEENDKAFKDYLNKAQKELFPAKVNELDIVYENIIKEGLNLNAKIEEVKIGRPESRGLPSNRQSHKSTVYKVSDTERELYVSLDVKLSSGAIEALTGKEYKDKIFICFDGVLNDSEKANLALNVALKTI